jgi:hypothetical protein
VIDTPSRTQRAFEIGCVVVLGVLIALAYAESFGAKNQQTYLLDGLRIADPDLYRSDWFVTQNHHYHFAFAYLTAPLFAIDPGGSVAIGIAHIVVSVATFAAIYGLVCAVTTRNRLLLFAGLAGFVLLGGGHSLGGGYLYAGYIQPSSLATLGWLVAMNAWTRDRVLLAGLALAAGAAFHLNYAVLGLGVFALCELVTQGVRPRRLVMLLCPSLVVVAVFLPTLIASSHSSQPKVALDVLVQFVFPGHFKPSRLRLDLLSLVGWHLIALALRPTEQGTPIARMFWFAMVTMASVILAVVVVSIPPLLGLTRLFTWRIAPLGILAAQVLTFVAVRDIACRDRARPRGWALVALLAGAAAIVYNAFSRQRELYPEVVSCTLLALAAAIAVGRVQVVALTCAALCAFALWTKRAPLMAPALFDPNDPGVLRWAQTRTPRDATFLVPPYYGEFRLLARRAVVVDDKSPPMYNDELVAWYRRLCEAVDAPRLSSVQDAGQRWDALSAERLVAIARHFQAGYVVLAKHRSTAHLAMPVAYEDADNIVYAVSL